MLASQRTLRSFGAVGAGLFVALAAASRWLPGGDDPVSRTLLVALLVVVPLALALVDANEAERPYFAVLAYLVPPTALAGACSILFDPGPLAGGAASLWVVTTLVVAAMGLGRLRSARPGQRALDLGLAAAFLYLPVGAVWLVLSRFGIEPLGLPSIIVALTAVHFHHGAFGALIVIAMAASRAERTRGWLAVALALAAAAMVVVAVAVTLAPSALGASGDDAAGGARPLATFGAAMLELAFLLQGAALAREVLGRLRHRGARVLVGLAALAPLATMALAALYTLGLVELDLMVHAHGEANAYLTVLAALAGWTLERSAEPAT